MGFIRAVCAATAFTASMCTHVYTHTYTYTRCASRFYEFRGECDAVNATGGEGTGYFVDWPLSSLSLLQIVSPYTYTRCMCCVYARLIQVIVTKEFPSGVQLFKVSAAFLSLSLF